ncbi:MAG: 2,3,4,5-tetrahydropyridine-2,6-dicarboxylate N-succinyltransferase, partial [Flavobacteriales bacterium CG_4_9_14_3_um_filter_32_8]
MNNLKTTIEKTWDNRDLLKLKENQHAIREVIELLDKGSIRVAEPDGDSWKVNEWVKKAVVLYFPIQKMATIEIGPFEFYDKMKLKTGYEALGVRVVP